MASCNRRLDRGYGLSVLMGLRYIQWSCLRNSVFIRSGITVTAAVISDRSCYMRQHYIACEEKTGYVRCRKGHTVADASDVVHFTHSESADGNQCRSYISDLVINCSLERLV